MCGIVGYVGAKCASEYVVDGLRRLEYRGYDSTGVATIHEGNIEVRRRKGKLSELQNLLRQEPILGTIAIGHTRWATHGKPSDENAHPHHVGDVVLVHNGIIENYVELKAELEGTLTALGRSFESETDTEVIAHLIDNEKEGTLADKVRAAIKKIRGAYAIVAIDKNEPDTLVVAKNASPLVIGVVDGAGVVASDIPALLVHTNEIIVLREGEMAVIRPGEINITDFDGNAIAYKAKKINWSPVMAEKGGHKHFMHKEIYEQPRALVDTLRGRVGASVDELFVDKIVKDRLVKAERIVFTACGTSFHAGLVGRLLFEDLCRVGCEVELASELRYRAPLMDERTTIVAVSQSGETADTLGAIALCKKLGAPIVGIVNVLDSSIARETEAVFYTHAGPEIGVASTKAFVTQVAALTTLAIAVGVERGTLEKSRANVLLQELRGVPRKIETLLAQEEAITAVASLFKNARSSLYLGRGYGHPVALEGALKLKEISYIHAEGYAAGEMKHGPIALIEEGLPVVIDATDSPVYEKVISNLQAVKARDGAVIALVTEGNTAVAKMADKVIFVPKIDPLLSPLLTTVPLQLLAYHVAVARGTDIDQPRNLAKCVTVE